MGNWVKWWKNKTILTILGIVLLTMLVAFLFAFFFDWGWIVALVTSLLGGYGIRRVIIKYLDELAEKMSNSK
jgi:uncharacterized membrane protein YdbT with pleckstrin-like domain